MLGFIWRLFCVHVLVLLCIVWMWTYWLTLVGSHTSIINIITWYFDTLLELLFTTGRMMNHTGNASLIADDSSENYEYADEDYNVSDYFTCPMSWCSFRGKCVITLSEQYFCSCEEWSYGERCQIRASGIVIGLLTTICILLLTIAVLFSIQQYLKHRKSTKNESLPFEMSSLVRDRSSTNERWSTYTNKVAYMHIFMKYFYFDAFFIIWILLIKHET